MFLLSIPRVSKNIRTEFKLLSDKDCLNRTQYVLSCGTVVKIFVPFDFNEFKDEDKERKVGPSVV